MKILITSYSFLPRIGGIENVTKLLAEGFTEKSCQVKVLTDTIEQSKDNYSYPYEVIRKPKIKDIYNAILWSDLIFQNNISLRYIWLNLFIRKPSVVTFHIWLDSKNVFIKIFKTIISKTFNKRLVVSNSLQKKLPFKTILIENPYDNEIFTNSILEKRDLKSLVFVGRLEKSKGCQTIINALGELRKKNKLYNLTVIGEGSFKKNLEDLTKNLKIENQINFIGRRNPLEVSNILRKSNLMIIPSLWEEPFGIVALEGLACGCKIICSRTGGLVEAINENGYFFNKGNHIELANIIENFENTSYFEFINRKKVESHLKNFKKEVVTNKYLGIFKNILKK